MNITIERLSALASEILRLAGACPEHAGTTAACLAEADACGVATHGVSRLETYAERLLVGVVDGRGQFEIQKKYGGGALCSGGNALGPVTASKAMKLAISEAKTAGCYTVFVNNSNHYGMASFYTRMAADRGFIAMTSTGAPSALAPWGSHEAFFGPTPLAIAFPGRKGAAVSLDMSPSVVPRGRLMLALQRGEDIPEGWALDKNGAPTTDPKEGWDGTLLPIGGHKGAGLAMCMDMLCGLVSGAAVGAAIGPLFGPDCKKQGLGHVFTVVDPELFVGRKSFYSSVDKYLAEIKSLPKNPGVDRLYAPGEIELERLAAAKRDGIELKDSTYEGLLALKARLEAR